MIGDRLLVSADVAAAIADGRPVVALESTVPSSLDPLESWISSTARTSGLRRLSTTCVASRSNFACWLSGARFSTLKAATDRSRVLCRGAVSRFSPPLSTCGASLASSL